jgi:hypothetical protein
MKKWILIGIIFVVGIFAVFTSCCVFGNNKEDNTEMKSGLKKDSLQLRIGKNFTVNIPEDVIVDASFIDKVNKGEIEYKRPNGLYPQKFFNLIGDEERNKLINYMADNQLVIEPGLYTINQAWSADKIIETLRFKKQDNK